MMRKIFGIKSISHLIYGLLMLAPILAIGVKCGYVMINKNAHDSYSGQSLDHFDTLTNIDDVELNKTYHFSSIPTYDNASNVSSGNIVYSNITNINTTDNDFLTKLPLGRYFIYYARVDQRQLYVYDSDNVLLMSRSVYTQTLEFDFTLDAYNTTYFQQTLKSFSIKSQTNNSYLDNVFYYAIDEIIYDNNFGKINFTGWFDNMMLDNNIQINQTYTHLFNWYLNYTLFISCAYILWLVLMWFVTFARKLLDRGMNYDW